jgi:hypothetical protein
LIREVILGGCMDAGTAKDASVGGQQCLGGPVTARPARDIIIQYQEA